VGHSHSWSQPDAIAQLSREPFGRKLAQQVADALTEGNSFLHCHRDYCGHGLIRDANTGRIDIVEVFDGYAGGPLISFPSRESFVEFLAEQSDYSLCGEAPEPPSLHTADPFYLNNQRITRAFLRQLLARI
jgi:hypothetical protein